jgi:hypothetical protein
LTGGNDFLQGVVRLDLRKNNSMKRRFKSALSKVPLWLVSSSGGTRFGAGIGFEGERKTFSCADGRFSGRMSRQDDEWQEKEKGIPSI